MIYQFKVELKYEQPPVWRILEVDSEMTFSQFHDVLQVVFEWENSHLHKFSIEKRDGKHVDGIDIGMDMADMGMFTTEALDETKEKLADWFIQEKDCTTYTYDFGDDWRHEVVLMKILTKEEGKAYPYCVKAVQVAPEEDSRGMMEENPTEVIDSRILTEQINMALGATGEAFDWIRLFEKAKELNKLKPWALFDDNQIFVVVDPVSGENLYCSVLGAAEYEFGLAVYIGEEGLQSLKDTRENTMEMFELLVRQRSMLLSFVDRDELEKEDYELIKSHGLTFRGRKQWVQFRSIVPGSHPWSIDEEEARMLLLAIEQTVSMCARGKEGFVVPVMGYEDIFPTRVSVEQDGSTLWMDDTIHVNSVHEESKDYPLLVSELDVARAKKSNRHNTSIEFDLFYVEFSIQPEEGERPRFAMMAAALDQKSGMALYQNLIEGSSVEASAQQAFIEFIEKEGFRPTEVWVTSKMKAMLAPLVKALRIDVMVVENLQNIAELKRFLSEME